MKKKVYLRVTKEINAHSTKDILELFEGDIKKDFEYWKKFQNQKPRYFLLKEEK